MKKNNLRVFAALGLFASGIPSAISVNGAHFDNVYQNVNLVATMGTEETGCSFSDEVRFVGLDGATITALIITDISGKLILDQKYAFGEVGVTWQATKVSEGILLYRCTLSNGESLHGRLLYSKKQ